MVPCRITLRGFLSFRDQQSLEFDDAALWMLAGPNGSGKSAVFDGVTYALFGWHRGGAKDAAELINKECDGFSVEFEFALGDERFQIRRTHKRRASGSGVSTQQISQWVDSRWNAVAETNQKRQFDAWIDSRIGLRYETFTSSVLLLQGQAEKLLGKGPADRFKVLSDIVDLDRYARLYERVDQRAEICDRSARSAQPGRRRVRGQRRTRSNPRTPLLLKPKTTGREIRQPSKR